MNSKFGVIFISFVFNVLNVFVVYASRLDSLVNYDDEAINNLKLSYKDIYNLHHSFVIENSKWENGEIYFKIDKRFTDYEIDKILDAMHEIEYLSCLRFAAHDPRNGPDYVMIRKGYNGSDSSADVGCAHIGEQILSLAVEMVDEHATILHELLHTIGFNHHHQRTDRDKYIEIHLENTSLNDSDVKIIFATSVKPDDRVTYLTPFDFNSVMMYDDDECSVNSKPVLTSKIEGKQLPSFGDRYRGLSKYDVILLNRFYDCHIVDKKKSKIFYEDEAAIFKPKIVNYHEIQRAKDYFVEDEVKPDNRLVELNLSDIESGNNEDEIAVQSAEDGIVTAYSDDENLIDSNTEPYNETMSSTNKPYVEDNHKSGNNENEIAVQSAEDGIVTAYSDDENLIDSNTESYNETLSSTNKPYVEDNHKE